MNVPALDIVMVLGIAVGAMALFVTGRVRVDVAALCVLAVLVVTGRLRASQALSGFASPATATVATMFVLRQTGGGRACAVVGGGTEGHSLPGADAAVVREPVWSVAAPDHMRGSLRGALDIKPDLWLTAGPAVPGTEEKTDQHPGSVAWPWWISGSGRARSATSAI